MTFTKWNNPKKKRVYRKIDKDEADSIAIKNMLEDKKHGIELPTEYYEHYSEMLQGKKV